MYAQREMCIIVQHMGILRLYFS